MGRALTGPLGATKPRGGRDAGSATVQTHNASLEARKTPCQRRMAPRLQSGHVTSKNRNRILTCGGLATHFGKRVTHY
jgi:hypothetical protein